MPSKSQRYTRGHPVLLPWTTPLTEASSRRSTLEKEYDSVCWMQERNLPLSTGETWGAAKDRLLAAIDLIDYMGRPDETGCA